MYYIDLDIKNEYLIMESDGITLEGYSFIEDHVYDPNNITILDRFIAIILEVNKKRCELKLLEKGEIKIVYYKKGVEVFLPWLK